jgi:hypothetical protein
MTVNNGDEMVEFDLASEIHNDKYVVFKRSVWDKNFGSSGLAFAVDDAIVIRRQDRFAASALDTYADQIQAMVELSEDHGHPMPSAMRDRMLSLSDFFRDQARMSRESTFRKFPD